MRRYGIRAIMAPPRRVRTTDSRHDLPIAPNLIARDFTASGEDHCSLARSVHLLFDSAHWTSSATLSPRQASIPHKATLSSTATNMIVPDPGPQPS